ncbi:hypothetical protein [Sulfurovum mangrovi]|uniref:hypothetical protein n=1 Tax=Sulfurovum mangrovi TaxID=2893889 RepID=UPI001E2BDD56|nr:hypothetical protein [Sulfurovum mangrovi]UFH60292.1 hypothetical protein LN246_05435 [Sulfurovum mangrovi]
MIKYITLAFLSIVLAFFFLNSTEQIGESIKTDLAYGTFDHMILDEKEAYLIRNHCTGKVKEIECSLKIAKSSVMSGYQHWKEADIDLKSTIYSPRVFDNNECFYMAVDFNDTYGVYKVSKESEDIEKLVSFKKKIEYFSSDNASNYIIVDNWNEETAKRDKYGRSVFDQNATNSIYENVIGENNWKYKGKINRHSWFTFDQNNNKYFLKRIGPYAQKTELRKNSSNDVISIKMTSISAQTVVIETDTYWFLGKENEKTILKNYKNGKWSVVQQFGNKKVFPRRLYKYKDLIVVITSEIDQGMLGGFGGTRAKMFISYDNGKQWQDYEPVGFYLGAYDFYKDKRFMAFTGFDEIMVIDFDKFRSNKGEE